MICESSCIYGAGWQTTDYGYSRPVAWPSQLAGILSLPPYNIPASSNGMMGSGGVATVPDVQLSDRAVPKLNAVLRGASST